MNKYQTYGAQPGTNSFKLLQYLRQNPDKTISPTEAADMFRIQHSSAANALSGGFQAGVYTREKRGAYTYYRFEKMPVENPVSMPTRPQSKKQQKYSEMLYTRRMKNEEYAEFKRSNTAKADIIIPDDVKITGMKLPENFGNRYAVKAGEVKSVFSALRPGQYLEAA